MVQTRWSHINRNYSFLTEVEAILLDGHFVLEHSGRARSGVFFNFNGTAGMWRRAAIDEAGGWEHDTLTDGIQDAAGAVGEGADSGRQENPAAGIQQRRTAADQGGGVVSPDGESQLSAHDRAFGAADAGDDHPLLSGMVPDALH